MKTALESLRELVLLKRHKNVYGKTALYVEKQPKAWEEAFQIALGTTEIPDAPIPMVLYCPNCGVQHIDAPEPSLRAEDAAMLGGDWPARWTNPPHRSHLCTECGVIWRPADVATTGVERTLTEGKADTWPNPAPFARPGKVSAATISQINAALYPAEMHGKPVTTDEYHLSKDMAAAPLGGKLIAVNPSGVAVMTTLTRDNRKDFCGWAPLPKWRKE